MQVQQGTVRKKGVRLHAEGTEQGYCTMEFGQKCMYVGVVVIEKVLGPVPRNGPCFLRVGFACETQAGLGWLG